MNAIPREQLRQRADYTHKPNLKTGRHGWLRLTPAYSVKVVEEVFERCDRSMRILDPFCGTATTALSAAYHGHEGVTTDINPFLIWLGRAKLATYSWEEIEATREASKRAVSLARRGDVEPASVPPIHNIERWWPESALKFLCLLRAAVEQVTASGSTERTLLMVAFCRTLIALSNAAFNHQSMSFKDAPRLLVDVDMGSLYGEDVRFVLLGAAQNPAGSAQILLADARDLSTVPDRFDLVVTSPPYANRVSYIRELRPYMYWLGFLVNGRDAGELDWTAIGGTWGSATSRLMDWSRPPEAFRSPHLDGVLKEVSHADNKNGRLLSHYIDKYFTDMWALMQAVTTYIEPGGRVHYIVGNSTFYG
ncbi:MAG: hypothetical protein RQ966_16275, partial [Acetobacteraceae bacterium]|nr:hypothetical protein [Acetobacteraceae bacterium]